MPPDRAAADGAVASGGIMDHRLVRLPEEVVQAVFRVPEHSVGVVEPARDPPSMETRGDGASRLSALSGCADCANRSGTAGPAWATGAGQAPGCIVAAAGAATTRAAGQANEQQQRRVPRRHHPPRPSAACLAARITAAGLLATLRYISVAR